MAKDWYILAYYDELNNLRLSPEVLRGVNPGDNVIWASNLDEQYVAGDFSSSGLFPDPFYDMPPNSESSPAQVQVQAAHVRPTPYLYTCSLVRGAAPADGNPPTGIIIVDPPGGGGDSHGKGKKGKAAGKKGR